MTNAGMNGINIHRLGGLPRGVVSNGGRGGHNFGAIGEVFSAVIAQKNSDGTVLEMADGRNFSTTSEVVGNVGDAVFFQVEENNALKQVFPNVEGQNFFGRQLSLQNLQDLMAQNDYVQPASSFLDVEGITQEKLEERQKATEAANRMKRAINRIFANVHSAAATQLAAEGINVDKMPVDTLNGIISQLDGAQANNEQRVYEELSQKLANVYNLNNGQIAQVLGNEADLTLDNLYSYKHSVGTAKDGLKAAQWQGLQGDVARFLDENGMEKTSQNLERVRFLLDNEIPLTFENFDKLVFLADVEGNVDAKVILPLALEMDAAGKSLGEINIYDAQKNALLMAETRLAMSYEANSAFLGTDLEQDLQIQIDGVKALKELAADTPQNIEKMAEVAKAVAALPQTTLWAMGVVAQNPLDFTPIGLNNHSIQAVEGYEQNATWVSIKYGDGFGKVAEQFAPLLRSMGFLDDAPTLRAAKILTANNMDINSENLAKIKDISAKIDDVSEKLHPRIAAAMVAEGMTPQNMHMDDILAYIEQHNEKYGNSTLEQLYENIAQMDKDGDIAPQVREQMMAIYQMLHKISKNNSAGVGFAVNAGIDLTLENLMEFSKNFDATKGRNNAINYAAHDGVYFAKHMVTSFVQSAKPRPLAAFVAQEPLKDPLAVSVAKIQQLESEESALDVEKVNASVKELFGAGREAIRAMVAAGVPVTLANLRQFKALKDNKLQENVAEIDAIDEILAVLPNADFDAIDAGLAAENLAQAAETLMDEAIEAGDTQKISQLHIIMQQLNFREMMLVNGREHSFAANFNNRIADVKVHVLNDNVDVAQGATAYLSLNTAMGEVEGLIKVKGDEVQITIAADARTIGFLRQNADDLNIHFVEKKAFKNQLSFVQNPPIY